MNRYDDLVRKIAMRTTHPDPITGQRAMVFVYRADGSKPEMISEEKLQQVEEQLGYTLPEDYREFVRDYGTLMTAVSAPLPEPTADGFTIGYVSVFNGIVPDYQYDLVQSNLEEELFSLGLIRIAHGDNGVWYLALEGEYRGSILFWGVGVEPEYESLLLVAPTFDRFLRLLARE